ncbi:hypothetical protein KI387_027832, partial [Taxus chinensis]
NARQDGCATYLESTEAGHGKGEHDGVGACVKRALAREELKYKDGAKLKDAKRIVEWCTDNMAR